jgi:hypothetical protein
MVDLEVLVDEQSSIYLFLAPELEALLADYNTDIPELLQHEGIVVARGFAANPVTDERSRQKDPALIILASAALIVSLTPILTRALEKLAARPVLVREQILVPVEDSKGNVLYNSQGEPMLRLEDRARYVEANSPRDKVKANIQGLGLSVNFDSSPKD